MSHDASGAYDKFVWTSGNTTWIWTDGDSQATETYGNAVSGGKYLITKATDTKGNALTFIYLSGGTLDKVTTADGGYEARYPSQGRNMPAGTTVVDKAVPRPDYDRAVAAANLAAGGGANGRQRNPGHAEIQRQQ